MPGAGDARLCPVAGGCGARIQDPFAAGVCQKMRVDPMIGWSSQLLSPWDGGCPSWQHRARGVVLWDQMNSLLCCLLWVSPFGPFFVRVPKGSGDRGQRDTPKLDPESPRISHRACELLAAGQLAPDAVVQLRALAWFSPLVFLIHLAVGQHQWYHIGVGAPRILVYFSGDWDV